MRDPVGRFSDRVENYVKARPGYPSAIVAFLSAECGLTPESVIADIGSGTGLLAELWLKNGNRVFGVEPNVEMRAAGERRLAVYPRFTSVAATAEATTLPAGSVDFVTAGQAFHWFDVPRAAREFSRILKSDGWVVLIWNMRLTDTTPFLVAYERLLQTYAPEYSAITDAQPIGAEGDFSDLGEFRLQHFENRQFFDLEGLTARLLSSSYTPQPGTPTHAPMLEELARIFQRYAVDGRVSFDYDTQVHYGRLGRSAAS